MTANTIRSCRFGMSTRLIVSSICLCVTLTAAKPASGQHNELLKYLPPSANALIVIDAESLMNSPMAVQNGWKNKRELEYAERPLAIPPEAKIVAVGAQLDMANDMETSWSLAVMDLSESFPVRSIARAEGGYVDTIADTQTAWTPTGAYFVELTDEVLGVMYPANRQAVGRWIRYGVNRTLVEISDYLSLASSLADSDRQIVMALDLADAVQPHRIREALDESPTLADHPEQRDQFAQLMMGLRGATLSIAVRDTARGRVQVDFNTSLKPLEKLAKPLFLETLDRFDAHLADVENWRVNVLDKTLILEGDLSDSSLRRIGSLLEVPSTKFSDLKDAQPAEAGTDPYTQASQVYFRSVFTLIEDLQKTLNDKRDNHAVWMERYARKIDALPILNVDDVLLDWGAVVAETFRSMAVSERSSGVRTGVRKSRVYTSYNYGPRYYGNSMYGGNSNSVATGKRNATIRTEEKGRASLERFNSWKEIEDSTAAIRRQMTQKYNVEF